jgi:RimJ/RimL family protein N-acetyltransferase
LELLTEPEVDLWNPAPAVHDLQSAADWCRRGADGSSGDHATFSIVVEATGALAGNVSVHNIDPEHRTADIGYRVAAAWRGRGVATAAVRAATAYALAEDGLFLFRVQLLHAVPNEASCRVAAKAGFTLEGTLRSAGVYAGERLDEHLHARLATDPNGFSSQHLSDTDGQ